MIALTGCVGPTPEPTPTPTAVFSSEEEAFAAAEETYRAYVSAENVRRDDALSEPDPQSFLVGEALERDIAAQREFESLGIRIAGPSVITSVRRISADPHSGDVALEACYDSSAAHVLNEAGDDVTTPDRDPTVMVNVQLVHVEHTLLIMSMSPVDGDPC